MRFEQLSILVNDCCLFSGSSGAPIHRVGSPPRSFCGIHIGRDPIPSDDLSKLPAEYNYGYSVFHPAFVLLYARYIAPSFLPHLPPYVRIFLDANRELLEMHREWISASLNLSLLLS